MGGRAPICNDEERGGSVLKRELRMTPGLQIKACSPCQPSVRPLWGQQECPEAGSVPHLRLRLLLLWKRFAFGRREESRRCKAVGERESGATGGDYEEYQTLRLSGQGCLMCSPANKSSTILSKRLCQKRTVGSHPAVENRS